MSKPANPHILPGVRFAGWQGTEVHIPHSEVTLRDLFAAFALAGLASAADHGGTWMGAEPEPASENAYNLADAMLAEREKAS